MDPGVQVRARSASFWCQTAPSKRGQDPFRGTQGRAPGRHRVPLASLAQAEVEVILEGDADEVGDGILGFLGELLGFGFAIRFGNISADKCQVQDNRQTHDNCRTSTIAGVAMRFIGVGDVFGCDPTNRPSDDPSHPSGGF